MNSVLLLVTLWTFLLTFALVIPLYWAIAYRWTDAGEKIDLVYAEYVSDSVFAGVIITEVILFCVFFASFLIAALKREGEIVCTIVVALCVYLIIRLPVGASVVASSCEASYLIEASSTSIFNGCSSFNKDVAMVGLFIDWVLIGCCAFLALLAATIGWCISRRK